ncbi:hypothetical protein [Piscinibacter sakaiensis]|uniref:hypothetical protein n=1 Tax=Piscinibacter sakaiensis TaxID=1547922 RepID=UPI003AB02855
MSSIKSIVSIACCSIALLFLTSVVRAAPMDPSGGQCSGLDPASGLFPTCIQAHSARNRIAHLSSTRANAKAVTQAQNSLAALLAQYVSQGGGVIPGFEPNTACPCWSAAELATIDGVSSAGGTGTNLICVVSPYEAVLGETGATLNDLGQTFAEINNDQRYCRFNASDSGGTSLISTFFDNLPDAEVDACRSQVIARSVILGTACASGS